MATSDNSGYAAHSAYPNARLRLALHIPVKCYTEYGFN